MVPSTPPVDCVIASASYVVETGVLQLPDPPLHTPDEHVWPDAHCLPQLPQLAKSVCVFTQLVTFAQ
jgi:hypothetical protein